MTRDEILNMPAGREMDALIAHNLMGYVNGRSKEHEYPDGSGKWWTTHINHYSTDIKAAWEVIEYFTNEGWCPGLLFDDNGHWALSFEGAQSAAFGDEPVTVSTAFFVKKEYWCDTAPLAICRAALLAVMK